MKSVKKNLMYNSIYQISAIIIPLIVTPYLSRVLGAEGLGQYAYSYSIAYYVTLFVKLGLNTYGNRTVALARDNRQELSNTFWNIYITQFLLGILLTSGYVVYVFCLVDKNKIALMMIFVIVSSFFDITWFFYGLEEFKTTTIRDISVKVITVIGIFIFVKNSVDVWKYTFIMVMGFLISQLLLWPSLLKRIDWVKPTRKEILRHLKLNLILFLPTVAVSLYKTMDKIMLGSLAGQIEVGYYESCEKVLNVPLAIINALGTVMLPHMTYVYAGDKVDDAIHIIRKSEHLMVMISSVIGCGIMAVASEFVPLFYGKGFEKCIGLFYILLPSCIFLAFANVIRTQYLIPKEKDKEFVISLFCGAIVNIITNLCLIPKYQAYGAAIGTLFAEMTVCIIQIIFANKYIPILKIGTECFLYVGISFIMFSIGVSLPIVMSNDIFTLIAKVVICGSAWILMMGVILLLKKDLYIREILKDIIKNLFYDMQKTGKERGE